jgi:phosphoribosylaminoimidazole-succinocarboxamide synthase
MANAMESIIGAIFLDSGYAAAEKFIASHILPLTEQIIAQGIVPESEYIEIEKAALALYQRGTELAAKQGLLLVDTKYEFGKLNSKLTLMDEIHTPDSSRYFLMEGYEEYMRQGKSPKQLSKEFVRQWLIENNFQGKEGQQVPEMTDFWVNEISNRYIELYKKITGLPFIISEIPSKKEIEQLINQLQF